MSLPFLIEPAAAQNARVLHFVGSKDVADWRKAQTQSVRAWCEAHGFDGKTGEVLSLPDSSGALTGFVIGTGDGAEAHWAAGALPNKLPPGDYMAVLGSEGQSDLLHWVPLSWALGSYAFSMKHDFETPDLRRLVWPAGTDQDAVSHAAEAAFLTRTLINTPAENMGPDALAIAAQHVADDFGATFSVCEGDDLLADNFPAIHAVGRAASIAPRLIDFTWGDEAAPKVTLVGKGVCFDSGGLNIKSGGSMKLMKKDMGGAANVLGLAHMIMAAGLPVRLRVLIPAVENAIAGNAFRPGDVVQTRKGLTVEVGNTDAEGRVVLSDALALACEEDPQLIIDCATLTGAARVGLGPDLPAAFTDDDELGADLDQAAQRAMDPLWRLPLWTPYKRFIESKVADINNAGDTPFAGAITAALFLKRFVTPTVPYLHLDMYAWNQDSRPGRPQGGEATGQRALFELIKARFA